MNLITIGMKGHWFVVSCPTKPRIFHDPFATCEEEAYDDLAAINGTVYLPFEIIALAYGEQRGFKMIWAV